MEASQTGAPRPSEPRGRFIAADSTETERLTGTCARGAAIRPHVPMRPLWLCRVCAAPWPCQPARLMLTMDYRRTGSGCPYMAGRLFDATGDLITLNPHAVPPRRELFERFLAWTRRRPGRRKAESPPPARRGQGLSDRCRPGSPPAQRGHVVIVGRVHGRSDAQVPQRVRVAVEPLQRPAQHVVGVVVGWGPGRPVPQLLLGAAELGGLEVRPGQQHARRSCRARPPSTGSAAGPLRSGHPSKYMVARWTPPEDPS